MIGWTERAPQDGIVIAPEERLPWPQTVALGLQHVVAMFGATVLAPRLMGFDPNLAILMSGVGTLIFFAVTRGRVPSYLGSSFAFIAVVIATTGYAGQGPNPRLGVALGGIIACGAVLALQRCVVDRPVLDTASQDRRPSGVLWIDRGTGSAGDRWQERQPDERHDEAKASVGHAML